MSNEESQQTNDRSRKRLKDPILRPGESWGNFRVVRCLSSSLIANYYHMQHARDLHDVTVCVFHRRTAADPQLLERLQGLQQVIQSVGHESIPNIRDCLEINERHCIFLDPVSGQSLSQYLRENGVPGKSGIDVGDVTRITAQLLGVLGCAHAQGLDHRDLDTDLIFVQDDGSLLILGMGVKATLGVDGFEAIVSSSVSPLVSSEMPGRLNSFDVMSPEYRAGVPEDSRVDVHAVGAIAYWLLTGKKMNHAGYQKSSCLVDGLADLWDQQIAKMTERDREGRYQSCRIALVELKQMEQESESERASFIQRLIDRIPVPEVIAERGDWAIRIYRLLVIGVIGVLSVAFASFCLRTLYEETLVPARVVAMVAQQGRVPDLLLSVDPQVAKVAFVQHQVQFVSVDGRLALSVLPGEYSIRVSAPNRIDQLVAISIEKRETTELEVELLPAWANLEVQSEPGATVFVISGAGVEVELGVTDDDGAFCSKEGVFAGIYDVVVRKQGYAPVTLEDQELALDPMVPLELPMEALPSSMTVYTEPAGARVIVDYVDVGSSPVTFQLPRPIGDYQVLVQLEGYRSVTRRVQVEAGDERLIDFGLLSHRAGELSFDVTFDGVDEAEAAGLTDQLEVELDGVRLPFGASELSMVKEGQHSLRLLHPRYESRLKIVFVQDQEHKVLPVQMIALPGRIEVVAPAGLTPTLWLDREPATLVEGCVLVPVHEMVELEVRVQDHLSMLRRFKMQPNETLVWEVQPVRIPGPVKERKWTVPYQGLRLAWVSAGSYQMGSPMPEPGRLPNEGPQTTVRFSRGFWVGAHEVTQAQYFRVMAQNPSEFVGASSPVEGVTWQRAQRFCEVLNNIEKTAGRLPDGYVYRLPTEAEWEYVARAGTTSPFTFGGSADASMGNFRGVYAVGVGGRKSQGAGHYGTMPVGSYEPNAFGLYDVHGNVAEWTLDFYNGRLNGGVLADPRPRADGRRIAVRGGSWEDFATRVRSAARDEVGDDTQSNAIGFRVVLAPAL